MVEERCEGRWRVRAGGTKEGTDQELESPLPPTQPQKGCVPPLSSRVSHETVFSG
jgi:hypothetical protein